MRIAGYARVSSDRQEADGTIDSQVVAIQSFMAGLAGDVAMDGDDIVFRDDGWPGDVLARPALTRLRQRLAAREIDAVVVYDLDRLARDEVDLYTVAWREIIEHGADLWIAKTGSRFEDSDEHHLIFGMLAGFARLERRKIGERAHRGGAHRARVEGKKNGGIPSYGFVHAPCSCSSNPHRRDCAEGRLILDPGEADWCRQMSTWLLGRLTPGRIATKLEELGVPTKYDSLGIQRKGSTRPANRWWPDQVRRILTNPLYAGSWSYRVHERGNGKTPRHKRAIQETIVTPVPAIFTVQEIEAHRVRIERNVSLKKRADGDVALLRSLVFCGECGRRYVASRSGPMNGQQRLYRCGVWHRPKATHDCSNKSWTAKRLEGAVWTTVAAFIVDPGAVMLGMEAAGQDADRPALHAAQLERRLAELHVEDERVRHGYRVGIYDEAQANLELQKSVVARSAIGPELATLRARMGRQRQRVEVEETIREIRLRLPDLTPNDRALILRELVERVTVTGPAIEIELIVASPQEGNRLAEICGQFLGKGQQVAIEGRIQTRSWDDEKSVRHWKTEIVASNVEMLSGRKKKDYEAQSAAEGLEARPTAGPDDEDDDPPNTAPREGSAADPLPVEAAA